MYPLADGLFAAKNQWYVAAFSSEITRDPMERWLLDEPVALYRKEDGSPVALDGRCPHRSYPLGKSRVVGDNVQCGYHGIQFRPDGSCAEIPSQANVPNVCKVRSYPIAERWQLVWFWPGDPALADESLIPDHYEMGLTNPDYDCAGDLYKFVPGRYTLMHDNLMDLTHLGFLHLDTLGADSEGAKMVPHHEEGPDWVESAFDTLDIDTPNFFKGIYKDLGKVDRRIGARFYATGMHVGGQRLYEPGSNFDEGKMLAGLMVFHFLTPARKKSCHYFFATGFTFKHQDPNFVKEFVKFTDPVIDEDVAATIYIEEMIEHCDGRPSELLLRADNVCVRGRRILERHIRADGNPPEKRAAA